MFLLIFGALNSGDTIDTRGGISVDDFFVPGLLAYGLVMTAFSNIATELADPRDNGVLKRMRGTPLPRWVFIAGRSARRWSWPRR